MKKSKSKEKSSLTGSETTKISNTSSQESEFVSKIDPSRETVGKIYRDAQLASHDPYVINGDITNELTKSLVDDLNETIASNPFDGKDFYITVFEKKDLQMPRAILRRLYKTLYRPWPEDDTIVFHVYPWNNRIDFCWCLPHHTEMDNMLINAHNYNRDLIRDIKAWKAFDLVHFGFYKTSDGKWFPYNRHKDVEMKRVA